MGQSLRPELEELPEQMRGLRVHRGYPVPFFVEWVKRTHDGLAGCPVGVGTPDFRIMSLTRLQVCIREHRCWTCGNEIGHGDDAFVIGPMCAVNHTSAEPPSHRDCGEWSARNCPFLSRPHARRRDISDIAHGEVPGIMLERNPGVAMVWESRTWTTFNDGRGGLLFDIGEPKRVTFWCEGRPATREEVEHSIDTGLPSLEQYAEADSIDAVYELRRRTRLAKKLMPAI